MINDYDKFAKERQEKLKKGIKKPHSFIEKPMMKELLPNLTGKKVLMLGCGTGEESQMLKEHGARDIIGIDLSKESIRLAKESYPDCEFMVGDMHSLPFDNETFDFIYSSLAVHYSETPEVVYKEIYRLLKTNGEVLFSIGHPLRWACEEIEVDGVKCIGIGYGINSSSDKVFGNYNTFKKHDHHFKNGEVLSFYVGSPSFHYKLLKKVGFTTEGNCIDEAKDIDYNFWKKFHEFPEFMAYLARK